METTVRVLLARLRTAASNSGRFFSSAAGSPVYKRALKVQRPTTIPYQENLHNFVSIIGVLEYPFKECKTANGGFGVHTCLRVTGGACTYLSVWLKFWNEIAGMSVQHLKLHDLVYVSGHLASYMKVDEKGKHMHRYEVNVSEVNFVAQHGLGPSCQNSVMLDPKVSIEDIMQRRRDRLHLWQIFFSNPHEWWDNRNRKLYPSAPDFKHKDTGEKLWLHANDPSWVGKQLQLHDSRTSKPSHGDHGNDWLYLAPLVYDDAERT